MLPQAVRISLPPTVGFPVQVVKNTSITSIIGFVELARAGKLINNATFQPFQRLHRRGGPVFVVCYPCPSCHVGWKGGSMPEVTVENVHKSFGAVEVLKGV